jgi:hypothetical protein
MDIILQSNTLFPIKPITSAPRFPSLVYEGDV